MTNEEIKQLIEQLKDQRGILDDLIHTRMLPASGPNAPVFIEETYKISKLSSKLKNFEDIEYEVVTKTEERFKDYKVKVCDYREEIDEETKEIKRRTFKVIWRLEDYQDRYIKKKRALYNKGKFEEVPNRLIRMFIEKDWEEELEKEILEQYYSYLEEGASEGISDEEKEQFSEWKEANYKPSDIKAVDYYGLGILIRCRK